MTHVSIVYVLEGNYDCTFPQMWSIGLLHGISASLGINVCPFANCSIHIINTVLCFLLFQEHYFSVYEQVL